MRSQFVMAAMAALVVCVMSVANAATLPVKSTEFDTGLPAKTTQLDTGLDPNSQTSIVESPVHRYIVPDASEDNPLWLLQAKLKFGQACSRKVQQIGGSIVYENYVIKKPSAKRTVRVSCHYVPDLPPVRIALVPKDISDEVAQSLDWIEREPLTV